MTSAVPEFVEEFGLLLNQLGIPRMPARVFALAIAAPEQSLTARQIAERLEVSPAAVSGALKYLVGLNIVRRTRVTGERVDRFGVDDDVWSPVFEQEIGSYEPLREICVRALEQGQFEGHGAVRVQQTADFLDFMRTEMLGVIDRWQARQKST